MVKDALWDQGKLKVMSGDTQRMKPQAQMEAHKSKASVLMPDGDVLRARIGTRCGGWRFGAVLARSKTRDCQKKDTPQPRRDQEVKKDDPGVS